MLKLHFKTVKFCTIMPLLRFLLYTELFYRHEQILCHSYREENRVRNSLHSMIPSIKNIVYTCVYHSFWYDDIRYF